MFLWPAWSRLAENGDLYIKASHYTRDSHATGERHISASATDFPFWRWVFSNRLLLPPILDEVFLSPLQGFYDDEAKLLPEALAPKDGCYLVEAGTKPQATEIAKMLKGCLDMNAVVTLQEADLRKREFRILTPFCRGLLELFCFKELECTYFVPLAESPAILEENLRRFERCSKIKDESQAPKVRI
jgi:hypothetical protein